MDCHLSLVNNEPRTYLVYLKKSGYILVNAECYTNTEYGWFAFYREPMEVVNKGYLKGDPPVPVYEIPKREVSSIAESGIIEIHTRKTRTTKKQKKAAPKKRKTKKISKKKKSNG